MRVAAEAGRPQAARTVRSKDDAPGDGLGGRNARPSKTSDVSRLRARHWGADGAEAPVAVGGGIPRERVRPRRSLVRRPQQPAAGSATPHPNSASESTNRTKSACREMDCFW